MSQLKVPFVLFFVLFVCSLAWGGGRQGPEQAFGGRGHQGVGQARGHQGEQGNRGARGNHAGNDQGRYGVYYRQIDGRQDDRKYRSNLYSDDDIYGYDAKYPNGEASYINYKSKDARARRGPEFARISRAYGRQGGGDSYLGQMNEYKVGGGGEW